MSELKIHMFPCLQDNYCYLIHDEETGTTGVIDTLNPVQVTTVNVGKLVGLHGGKCADAGIAKMGEALSYRRGHLMGIAVHRFIDHDALHLSPRFL